MGNAQILDLLKDWPPGKPVPTISVRQPWAAAIAWLGKDVENRDRWLYKHRGPVLIHAAGAAFYREDVDTMLKIARQDGATDDDLEFFLPDSFAAALYPRGAIVAAARLEDVVVNEGATRSDQQVMQSPWRRPDARFWLYLPDVEPCNPVRHKGQVGLFTTPYDIAMSLTPFDAEVANANWKHD